MRNHSITRLSQPLFSQLYPISHYCPENAPYTFKNGSKVNDYFAIVSDWTQPTGLKPVLAVSGCIAQNLSFSFSPKNNASATFYKIKAPQLWLYQNCGTNVAKDCNFDTMHPFQTERVHFCFGKAIVLLLIWSLFVKVHNIVCPYAHFFFFTIINTIPPTSIRIPAIEANKTGLLLMNRIHILVVT